MIHRRLRARREASTGEANCDGSMMGRPRHGDMLVRSASAETMRNAPTAAPARSQARRSGLWSGHSQRSRLLSRDGSGTWHRPIPGLLSWPPGDLTATMVALSEDILT